MAKVLITSEYFTKFSPRAKEILLEAGHTVIDNPYGHKFLSPEEIIPYAGEAEAFICDLEKINREVMEHAPNLKIIARRGVGVDSVDLGAAKDHGVTVARTLGAVEAPVAELVMTYILMNARRVPALSRQMKNHVWDKQLAYSSEGKVLGIVGMGSIAKEVVRRAKAFHMDIAYYDIFRNEAAEREFGVRYLPFDELLSSADYLSIHVPLTAETTGMFGYETLCKCKPTAYLINTARGPIVDEEGLARAIREKKLAGAAIDVFDVEPKTDSVLAELDEVTLTPHVATFTQETFVRMDILAAENVVKYFRGEIDTSKTLV